MSGGPTGYIFFEKKEEEKEKEKEINPKKNVPFVKRLWCLCEYFEALTYAICIIYVETEEISKQHLGTDVAIVNIKKPTGDALDNLPATTFVKMVEDLPKPDADEELTTKCHVLDVMRHALCVNSPSTYITVGFTLSFVLASVCLIVALFVESDVLWKLAVFLLIDGLLNLLLLIPFPRGGVFSFRLVLCVLVVPVIIYFRLEGGLVFFILFLLYILLRFLFSFCCLVIPFPLSVVSTGWLFFPDHLLLLSLPFL
uniref:Uncharacterized protein n=1 Tax=Paramoeba aestuarina TaxID=180227 RepID=A0A7S4P8B3_9EUKA|mmetsp:Transcript_3799/g.5831  ORF Transcript_3799/g.5831 Transcript_3799/m.5831 type:complete len:255 (+) Transcript_3799:811-1575(+)